MYNVLKSKANIGDRKKRRGIRKGKMRNGGITQTKNKTKKGERDYNDEAVALMNLQRALMSVLDTEIEEAPGKNRAFRLLYSLFL